MLNQIIEVIKNTTIATVGLVVGLFSVGNASLPGNSSPQIDQQEQVINLAKFAQANIIETLNSEAGSATKAEVVSTTTKSKTKAETVSTTVKSKSKSSSNEVAENFSKKESIDDLRAVNPIKTTKTINFVDTTKILETDFDTFDMELQITEIKEDSKNFYVAYQYKTLAVQDRVWGEVMKKRKLSISKKILGEKDLGVYLSEELAEVLDTEIIYLKEVQQIQILKNKKEETTSEVTEENTKTIASNYTSLIGKLLNVDENKFSDYQPVTKKEEISADTPMAGKDLSSDATPESTTVVNDTSSSVVTEAVDDQAPLIVIQGNNPALVQIGSSYIDLGAKVTDNVSEGIGIKVSGDTVNTAVKGSYFVIYTATDEAGNIATASREVIVYDYGVNIPEKIVEEKVKTEATSVGEEDNIKDEESIENNLSTSDAPDTSDISDTLDTTNTTNVIDTTETASTTVEEKELLEETVDNKEVFARKENVVATSSKEVREVKIKKGKARRSGGETPIKITGDSVDSIQQGTGTAVAETIGGAIDTSAGVVQETVDAVVEVTAGTVNATIENVMEATGGVVEEITAMLLAVDIKSLLGNVNSSVDVNIGEYISKNLNELSLTIFDNINKVKHIILNKLNGWLNFFNLYRNNINNIIQTFIGKTFVSTAKNLNYTAQILSSGTYEVIGDIADSSYNTFNLIWKNVRGMSKINISSILKPITKVFISSKGNKNYTAQVLNSNTQRDLKKEGRIEKTANAVRGIYSKVSISLVGASNKITKSNLLAGVSYSKSNNQNKDLQNDGRVKTKGFLKEKVLSIKRFVKGSIDRTLNFFENNRPII